MHRIDREICTQDGAGFAGLSKHSVSTDDDAGVKDIWMVYSNDAIVGGSSALSSKGVVLLRTRVFVDVTRTWRDPGLRLHVMPFSRGATVSISGSQVYSVTDRPSGGATARIGVTDTQTLTITVTSEDGNNTKTYTYIVEPDLSRACIHSQYSQLASLTVNAIGGSVVTTPTFRPARRSYVYWLSEGSQGISVSVTRLNEVGYVPDFPELHRVLGEVTERDSSRFEDQVYVDTYRLTTKHNVDGQCHKSEYYVKAYTPATTRPVGFYASDAETLERPGASLRFKVELHPAQTRAVTVDYETDEAVAQKRATPGIDYVHTEGRLTFEVGETEKWIDVPVLDDDIDEIAEYLVLKLTFVSGSLRVQHSRALGAIYNSELTAAFQDLPAAHDGTTAFKFRLAFSQAVTTPAESMRDDALSVSGGVLTAAELVDGRDDLWELTLQPSGPGPVSLSIASGRDCTESGAVCTPDGRPLSVPLFAEVPELENEDARGAPSISGTTRVGERLSAVTSAISDPDGMTDAEFSYQWIRNDGTDDVEISGATSSTYTLVEADEGMVIKVQVSFTDDGGYNEHLTSAATGTVAARPNRPATGAPQLTGAAHVGQTLSVGTSGIADADGLANASFSYQWIRVNGGTDSEIDGETSNSYTLAAADEGETLKVRVSFTDDRNHEEALSSAPTDIVRYALILGTAAVGQTLTVDTSAISDPDGMTDTEFSYQWVRSSGTVDTDITGATASTYTLGAADEDSSIKVRVSYTDDADNDEELTSAVTDTVVWVPIWTSRLTAAPVYEEYGYINLAGNRSGSLTNDAIVVDGVTYTIGLIEAGGFLYIGVDRELPFGFVLSADSARFDSSDAIHTSYSYAEVYHWSGSEVYWDDGDEVDLALYLNSAPTPAEAASNSAATGAPTISGTPTVGQTLTADTSGISDADGLDDVSYSYQWISNDGTSDSDISGATGSTYTLTDDDQGKTVKVKVSFTDDAGNDEALTSAATGTVAARPNRAATGAPTITGTAQVGQTLTAGTSGISDADGLDNVSYSYQWISNDGTSDSDISGATSSTYALVDADQGNTIKVKVSFTDDRDNEESLTSAATGEVVAAPIPLTVRLENEPSRHNGAARFTFQIRFSEELRLSFRKFRDHAFTVSGGEVKKAKRLAKGSNIGWKITVEPDSDDNVEIVLAITKDCSTTSAICTEDGRKLSNKLEFTVAGP